MSNRVLIVEDDRNFASSVKEIVDKHGHTAVVAPTGPAGLEMYERHEPDLLVVDVMLPGMTGIQVIEQVRELPGGSDVPILLMSAMYKSAEFFRDDMQRLGLLDFLPKPFSLVDFGRRVDAILDEPEKGRSSVRALTSGKTGPDIVESPSKPSPGSAQQEAKPSAGSPSKPEKKPATNSKPSAAKEKTTPRKSHPQSEAERTVSYTDGGPFHTDSLEPQRYIQLISTLFHSHSSGTFDLLAMGASRSIYFLNGYPVWIDVPNTLDGLPRYLADESLLSKSQMAKVVEHAEGNGGDVRAAISKLKLIPDDELPPILEEWISSELQKGLTHRGAARFERSEGFSKPVRIQEINPITALWKGVYRISDDDWFERELSVLEDRTLGRTRSFPKLFGYLGRDPRLRKVSEAIREPKTSEQFLERMDGDRGLGTRALWFMVSSGLLSFSEPASSSEGAEQQERQSKAQKRAAQPKRPQRSPAAAAPPPRKAAPPPPVPESPPPKPPEPEERHVFFEPSRKSAKKAPKASEDLDPIEVIRIDHAEKMDLNHYGFLEIEQDATKAEIEEAYNELAPSYRPQNLGSDAPDEIKQMARKLLARLVLSHEELSDAKRRARYDLSEASRKPGRRGAAQVAEENWDDTDDQPIVDSDDSGPWYPGQHDPSQIRSRMEELDAEDAESLLAAHTEIKRGEFKKAFARLDELRAFDPSNSFVLADLGWCQFSLRPNDAREVEKALEWVDLALAFQPTHRNALEVKARILVSLEDPESDAGMVLRNLLKVVPDHSWAKRELAAEEAQKEAAQPEKKRGLRDLMNRGRDRKKHQPEDEE